MVLPVADTWGHEGTSAVEAAAAPSGTVGDSLTAVVEEDAVFPLVVCRPSVTSVEHP
jgi:hypothetical protein